MNLLRNTILLLLVLFVITPYAFAMGPKKPAVVINADPEIIDAGSPVTLSWSSSDATTCTIDNGIGSVELNGSRVVFPSDNITYTITADGDGGIVTASASVTVKHPPEIVSFTASAASINQGESVTLTWETNGADSCNISPAPGSVSVSDTTTMMPDTNTTYTLNAENSDGSDSESISVVVVPLVHQVKTFEYDEAGRIKNVISEFE